MRLYVIGGKARSGKTTFGIMLREELKKYGYKPCVMHITEPLYNYAENYFNYDKNKDDKPREFLQQLGIQIIKEKMNKKTFLIDRLCEDIDILSNFFDCFIITDARLIMEFDILKEKFDDVITIYIERNNVDDKLTDEERHHITETEVSLYPSYDYKIIDKSLEEETQIVENIVKETEARI